MIELATKFHEFMRSGNLVCNKFIVSVAVWLVRRFCLVTKFIVNYFSISAISVYNRIHCHNCLCYRYVNKKYKTVTISSMIILKNKVIFEKPFINARIYIFTGCLLLNLPKVVGQIWTKFDTGQTRITHNIVLFRKNVLFPYESAKMKWLATCLWSLFQAIYSK